MQKQEAKGALTFARRAHGSCQLDVRSPSSAVCSRRRAQLPTKRPVQQRLKQVLRLALGFAPLRAQPVEPSLVWASGLDGAQGFDGTAESAYSSSNPNCLNFSVRAFSVTVRTTWSGAPSGRWA